MKERVEVEEEMQGWCTLRCTKLVVQLPCMPSAYTTLSEGMAVKGEARSIADKSLEQSPKQSATAGNIIPLTLPTGTTPPSNSLAPFAERKPMNCTQISWLMKPGGQVPMLASSQKFADRAPAGWLYHVSLPYLQVLTPCGSSITNLLLLALPQKTSRSVSK